MESNSLHEELLSLWHQHRNELLISAGLLLAIVRLAQYWRQYNRKNLEPIQPSPKLIGLDSRTLQPISKDIHFPQVLTQNSTSRPLPREPRRIKGLKPTKKPLSPLSSPPAPLPSAEIQIQPLIFYFSLTGTTSRHATALHSSLSTPSSALLPASLYDLSSIDYDDFFLSLPASSSPSVLHFYLFLLPSYDIDTALSPFLIHLQETHHDFRVGTAPLAGLAGYAVFGIGDSAGWKTEREGYCSQAVEVDRWMARLTGGKRAFPVGRGDVSLGEKGVAEGLREWVDGVTIVMKDIKEGKGLGEGVVGSGEGVESDEEDEDEKDEGGKRGNGRGEGDIEDVKDVRTMGRERKAMVPVGSPTYTALTKQGYTIVGTHSGVKICRWTKSALRGRGSCYKYSFYGIASHQCMEATPSLSCSNKCVFCWRHGTNPVGTTWRWEVDEPETVFDGIKEGHYKKIKVLRGVPGVRSERFAEAMRIRHCALSLVGEPIFYPHINALLGMLHREHISSFLVCNAQHPDHLAALGPVTQLYVSIDAADKASLKAIDRPLHRDFWDRFLRCMDILYAKRRTHRTVFRLTLVKTFNASLEEISGYADLVQRARPSFVEVKGVTYCGTSTAAGAGLTMANVPFYDEVRAFVLALKEELLSRGLDYGIGAEHAHSCCILLADTERYFRASTGDGQKRWHTLIDYPKFFACLESGEEFAPEDYVSAIPTPEWALWGNGGFDPRDQRVDRKGRPKVVEV